MLQPADIWAWPPLLRSEGTLICALGEEPTSRLYYLPSDIKYRTLLRYLCIYSYSLVPAPVPLSVHNYLFAADGALVLAGSYHYPEYDTFRQAYRTTPVPGPIRFPDEATSPTYYPFTVDDPRSYPSLVDKRRTGYVLPIVALRELDQDAPLTARVNHIHGERDGCLVIQPYMTRATGRGLIEANLPCLQAWAYSADPRKFLAYWAAQPTLPVVDRVILVHDKLSRGGVLLHVIYAPRSQLIHFRTNTRVAKLAAPSPAVLDYTPAPADPRAYRCAFLVVRLVYDIGRRSYHLEEEQRVDYETWDAVSFPLVHEHNGQLRLVQPQVVDNCVSLSCCQWDESGPFTVTLPGWRGETSFEFSDGGVLYARSEEEVRWWS